MGMLMDFYVGDEARIVAAWEANDLAALGSPDVVAAQADLSFHLGPEELDQLVAAACELRGRPPMAFHDCLVGAGDPRDEARIQPMSDDFRDLLAGLTPAQAGQLVDRWVARWPPEQPPAPRRRSPLQALRHVVQQALLVPVFALVAGVAWLSSRDFRETRRLNRAKLAAADASRRPAPAADEVTGERAIDGALREAVTSLVAMCRVAKARSSRVLYAWSL